MRFEEFEPRIVFDQSLGPAVEIGIDTSADVAPTPELPELPDDIQFHPKSEDFRYSGNDLDSAKLDELVKATVAWSNDPIPIATLELDADNQWWKPYYINPISISNDGYIVAERNESQLGPHSLLLAQKPNSDCHTRYGHYLKPDYHYRYSFDVRHPESETGWLSTVDWSIVSEIWGPGHAGTGTLNPPFSIFTRGRNGVPNWVINSRGDSRVDTVKPYEEERSIMIPYENIGEWQRWDVEFVPNSFGQGLARVWLNGELVVDWVDVKTTFHSPSDSNPGEDVGPVNPAFGLYSYDATDSQEAHFDNILFQCNGEFQSSISGRVTGAPELASNTVFATNESTGEKYGVETEADGVYVLAVPKGEYTITAVNQLTGHQTIVSGVSTLDSSSRIVDLDVTTPDQPLEVLTFTGDVTGDGIADVVNRLADGKWQVTTIDTGVGVQTESDSSVWGSWSTNVEWTDIMMTDLNGDGKQDMVGRAENGSWWAAESTGTSFHNRNWGRWTPGIEWSSVTTGDFNGDGLNDIIGRAPTDGSWWVAESQGDVFKNVYWGKWTTRVNWEVMVGDFTGDGLDDIAGRASSNGSIWIGASDGVRFKNSLWGTFVNTIGWSEFQVGDFNGDGISDLVSRADTDGSWWVAESTGSGFVKRYFGIWNKGINWSDVQIVDINNDGISDIVGRADSDNSWWIAKSNGDKFKNQYWGATWAQDVDWLVAIADDFDGDGKADLLGATEDSWLLAR